MQPTRNVSEAPGQDEKSHPGEQEASAPPQPVAWMDSWGEPHRRKEDARGGPAEEGYSEPTPLYAAPPQPVPAEPPQPMGSRSMPTTMHVKCSGDVWESVMDELRERLRGWLIVSEAMHGHEGWFEVEAVKVNDSRHFTAYDERATPLASTAIPADSRSGEQR